VVSFATWRVINAQEANAANAASLDVSLSTIAVYDITKI
jgi:hypothetical protein